MVMLNLVRIPRTYCPFHICQSCIQIVIRFCAGSSLPSYPFISLSVLYSESHTRRFTSPTSRPSLGVPCAKFHGLPQLNPTRPSVFWFGAFSCSGVECFSLGCSSCRSTTPRSLQFSNFSLNMAMPSSYRSLSRLPLPSATEIQLSNNSFLLFHWHVHRSESQSL
jgi:hypothetical protein